MEHIPFPTLLQHLYTLLPDQRQHVSSSEDSSLRVLPKSIPLLPRSSSQLPASTSSITEITTYLNTHILPYLNQSSLSPNYYGFVTGGSTPIATLTDFLVTLYDQNVQVHLPSETIATNVEVAALNQLVQLFGLGREWEVGWSGGGSVGSDGGGGNSNGNGYGMSGGSGTFTTGATASNILGLAMGREFVLGRAIARRRARKHAADGLYGESEGEVMAELSCANDGIAACMLAANIRKIKILSTLPHSSIGKAASVVGLGRGNVVSVAKLGGDGLGIDLNILKKEMEEEGTVSILVMSAGEVNTGRFATEGLEVMREVRRICDEEGVWCHVDGAFGLFGRVLMAVGDEEGEYGKIVRGVKGIELADSITGDAHKLLNVPYDCGFFFTRHKGLSERVFANGNAAYLTAGIGGDEDGVQSPLNVGLENSRRFRALPVHATLMAYGREGYVGMLKRQVGLARRVVRWLWRDGRFDVLPEEGSEEEAVGKTFMIVLFRARDGGLNEVLASKINATGRMYVSGTKWAGETAVRIAVSNWQVDVERDGRLIEEVLDEVESS